MADNNSTSLCPSSVLITQEKPLGKIYWAIGTQEYFANGAPGYLPHPLHCCLFLESPGLWGCVCRSSLVSLGGHSPSMPGLLNSLAEALTGGTGAVCLWSEALTFPHRRLPERLETACLPHPEAPMKLSGLSRTVPSNGGVQGYDRLRRGQSWFLGMGWCTSL